MKRRVRIEINDVVLEDLKRRLGTDTVADTENAIAEELQDLVSDISVKIRSVGIEEEATK